MARLSAQQAVQEQVIEKAKLVLFLVGPVGGQTPAPRCNHGKPLLVGIFWGISVPGFRRWCRISSIRMKYPNQQAHIRPAETRHPHSAIGEPWQELVSTHHVTRCDEMGTDDVLTGLFLDEALPNSNPSGPERWS